MSNRIDLIASLAMYDLPHLQKYNDLLWRWIAERLEAVGIIGVPDALARHLSLPQLWTDPNLLLAQTCGYPLTQSLSGRVKLVATPRYRAEGCRSIFHRSCVVVRAKDKVSCLADLKGLRCVVNELHSNTGMNLFRALIAPYARGSAFFSGVSVSGSHFNSLKSIVAGDADVAAIDCVTFAHLKKSLPDLVQAVRIVAWSDETPSLPLITAIGTNDTTLAALQQALLSVEKEPHLADARENLLLHGFDCLPERNYDLVRDAESRAVSLGYPLLL